MSLSLLGGSTCGLDQSQMESQDLHEQQYVLAGRNALDLSATAVVTGKSSSLKKGGTKVQKDLPNGGLMCFCGLCRGRGHGEERGEGAQGGAEEIWGLMLTTFVRCTSSLLTVIIIVAGPAAAATRPQDCANTPGEGLPPTLRFMHVV